MNYPGNATLAEEIRERILNTFRQTLALAEKGDQREAQLGCDFVLRLDPLFDPARELHDRLQAGSGPVDVADLRDQVGESAPDSPPAPAEPEPEESTEAIVLDLDSESRELDSALDLSSLQGPAAETSTPPPAAAAAAVGSEPVAALDNESEGRVQDLLEEGEAAFDRAEYQSAIDSWSRIFLIDIDHPEANRRIDLARKLKAEVERKLEETYHDALTKVEAGRLDEARTGFEAVLSMMPGHIAAQEYLERLDSPDFVAPTGPPAASAPSAASLAPVVSALDDSLETDDEFADLGGVLEDPLELPVGSEAEARPAIGGVGKASKPQRSPNQTFRYVGIAALVALAVVGWFLYKNWNSFFPNATDASVPVQLDPITRAKRTYAEAGAAIAVAQLRRLSPGHPQYAEAQALVAQWEASLDANKPKQDAPEPEALASRDRLVEQARTAFQESRFLRAQELLERAASQAPLEAPTQELLEKTKDHLTPLAAEIAMYREGEWEMALRNLWRIWESGTTTPDVRRLMVDSYFNLGVRDLQRQDTPAALEYFLEARELTPSDPDLARLIEFSEVYQDQPEDLLYRIFVKYLPFR